jgi:hypothetical protein
MHNHDHHDEQKVKDKSLVVKKKREKQLAWCSLEGKNKG